MYERAMLVGLVLLLIFYRRNAKLATTIMEEERYHALRWKCHAAKLEQQIEYERTSGTGERLEPSVN